MSPATDELTLAALVARAGALAADGRRALLGIAGAPGSGKSVLAARLVGLLAHTVGPGRTCCVPMDGFHLAQGELSRLGRTQRKGAPDTFDGTGYAVLLARLRADAREVVYAPTFDRRLEEPVAGSIAIDRRVRLVITEGNYLLLPDHPWSDARENLDEVWFCDAEPARRRRQLVARHVRFGKSEPEAAEWVDVSDEANARLVEATRRYADLVVPDSALLGLAQRGAER